MEVAVCCCSILSIQEFFVLPRLPSPSQPTHSLGEGMPLMFEYFGIATRSEPGLVWADIKGWLSGLAADDFMCYSAGPSTSTKKYHIKEKFRHYTYKLNLSSGLLDYLPRALVGDSIESTILYCTPTRALYLYKESRGKTPTSCLVLTVCDFLFASGSAEVWFVWIIPGGVLLVNVDEPSRFYWQQKYETTIIESAAALI